MPGQLAKNCSSGGSRTKRKIENNDWNKEVEPVAQVDVHVTNDLSAVEEEDEDTLLRAENIEAVQTSTSFDPELGQLESILSKLNNLDADMKKVLVGKLLAQPNASASLLELWAK